MPWSILQRFILRISAPLSFIIALYVVGVAALTMSRLLRISGFWLVDLANVFAPYWYMPLALTIPLSLVFQRAADAAPKPKRRASTFASRTRAGCLALLQIALVMYGLAAFAWQTRYKPVEPPIAPVISVVSFNVQGSNANLDRAVEWLLNADADVVVLQETSEGYDARLARLYAAYAGEAHIESSVRVFSRFPIISRDAVKLEDAPGWLALRLLLDHDGREVAVYAVHLALPRKHKEILARMSLDFALNYDESRRNAQIRRALSLLRDDERPFIFAGDFNMSDSSLIYDEIANEIHDAWRGAGNGAGRTWPLAEEIGLPRIIHPLLRIDYIWHSDHFRAVTAQLGHAIGSDHLPLMAELEWLD